MDGDHRPEVVRQSRVFSDGYAVHRDPPVCSATPGSQWTLHQVYYLHMSEDKKVCSLGVDSQYVEMAAEVFRLLSDATRIRIVLALRGGELSVNQLAEVVEKTPTIVSQHLAKMRWARMVAVRKDGTRAFYSLTDEHARRLVCEAVFQAEHALDETPVHHDTAMPLPPSQHQHLLEER